MQFISNLYKHDARFGDGLLNPQRWCHRQWSSLTVPLGSGSICQQSCEVAKRVGKVALLVLPTLGAYLLTIPGIFLKAFQPGKPPNHDLIVVNTNAKDFKNRVIPCDLLMTLITNFIDDNIVFNWLLVCKRLYNFGEREKKENFLLCVPIKNSFYGAGRMFLINLFQGTYPNYFPPSIWKRPKEDFFPTNQKRTYDALMEQDGVIKIKNDETLEVLCRLIPGGPVAFSEMYTFTPEDGSCLTEKDLPWALVRGKDKKGILFFAMRLKVSLSDGSSTKIALVFTKNCANFEGWIQQENSLLPQNYIKWNNEPRHFNMTLRWIKKIDGVPPNLSRLKIPGRPSWTAVSVE